MSFDLVLPYQPAGDQNKAIAELVGNISSGIHKQVLLGVTGSGKTFTIANVISKVNRPTLILSHNKTLAAQLYSEFCAFFPNNAVEYFVSYYDYYQPEVYIPSSGVYIEKALAINDDLDKLRLHAIASLLSGRKDIVVIASVSCIYGLSKPDEIKKHIHSFTVGERLSLSEILRIFVSLLYSRSDQEFARGKFRVMGDTVDIFLSYTEYAYRFVFWGDQIESICRIDPASGKILEEMSHALVFPAELFVLGKDLLHSVIGQIELELGQQVAYFEKEGKFQEAKRLKERTALDLEMLRELGYCHGIENYSRYMDQRQAGQTPFCLLDYFPEDYLMVIDESHVSIPQFKAMWKGDRARKLNLVEYGFRLPSALDNRPLSFSEFEKFIKRVIFVSATPAEYELSASDGVVVEQIIRPTGLLDPQITVKPTVNQIHDILKEIEQVVSRGSRVLVTTLTKRMAEELTAYLVQYQIKARYLHSEVKTLDRVTLLDDLCQGIFDVLVGVNLLREGLDLPQVELVLILDADKEGFLRNERSLIQTIGRVARHVNGRVIMYADTMTTSMQKAIEETERRRQLQMAYNAQHHITPTSAVGASTDKGYSLYTKVQEYNPQSTTKDTYRKLLEIPQGQSLEDHIQALEEKMFKAAEALRFTEADQIKSTIDLLRKKQSGKI